MIDTSLYIYICVKHFGMANIKKKNWPDNLNGRGHFEDVCAGHFIMLTFIFRLLNIAVAPDSRIWFHFKCQSLHLTGTAFPLSPINSYF